MTRLHPDNGVRDSDFLEGAGHRYPCEVVDRSDEQYQSRKDMQLIEEMEMNEAKIVPVPMSEWEWFGYPGHLCVAARCQFRLCTRVGNFLISTIGDYYPDMNRDGEALGERETIGAGNDSFFETYVFRSEGMKECGCCPSIDLSEIDGERTPTATLAQMTHMKYCHKYAGGAQ